MIEGSEQRPLTNQANRRRADDAQRRRRGVRVEREVRHLFEAQLEVDDKRGGNEQRAYDTKPQPALAKVWINAQQNASNNRHQFHLPSSIKKIRHANRACDDTEDKVNHGAIRSTSLCCDPMPNEPS